MQQFCKTPTADIFCTNTLKMTVDSNVFVDKNCSKQKLSYEIQQLFHYLGPKHMNTLPKARRVWNFKNIFDNQSLDSVHLGSCRNEKINCFCNFCAYSYKCTY